MRRLAGIVFVFLAQICLSQEVEVNRPRILGRMSFGPYLSPETFDDVALDFTHPKRASMVRIPNVSGFIWGGWGLEASASFVILGNTEEFLSDYRQFLEDKYGQNFYLSQVSIEENELSGDEPYNSFIFIGPCYRFWWGQISLVPRIQLGGIWYETYKTEMILKEKDANAYWRVNLTTSRRPNTNVVFSPGMSVNFPVTNRFGVCVDLSYLQYVIDLKTTESFYNLYNQSKVSNTTFYRHRISAFSLQLGMALSFWNMKK